MVYPLTLGTLSFLAAVIWGAPLIRWLKGQRIGKQIRIEGPSSHQVKTGTPTMGGIMILVPVFFITLLVNIVQLLSMTEFGQSLLGSLGVARTAFAGRSILVPLGVMISFGLLGAIDDFLGVRRDRGGLPGRWKMAVQLALATTTALVLHFGPPQLHSVALPGVAQRIDIGLAWLPIAVFIIVGMSNAVNLTDGLDGLAGSLAAMAFAAYGVIAFLQDQGWLVTFCFTMVGAVMAFLWYNAYPAELFMGDTGSLALGATLGTAALMTGQWLLLPVVGLVFVAVTVSVILQVGYFKLTKGKRLFKMAPLQHHFELMGWSEVQVVQRFWLVGILAGMLGIALALI
jgi:phospho-N-acetylmuramoyl-pentapeptide-transferase